MKFTINAKQFASALGQQLRVINAKNTIAILDTFKLDLTETGLIITASDPETTSTLTIEPTSIDEQGIICINASKLTDIVRKLGDKPITFEANVTEAKITCGKGVYTLPVLKAEEYPVRQITTEGFFKLPTQTLIGGLMATKGAMSSDTIRPVMCGVYMNVLTPEQGGGIDFVATDTHQLVVCHAECEGIEPRGVIIPAKVVGLVLNLFAKYPEIDIAVSERNIVFRTEDATLMSVLIQGSYPNYNRVMPTNLPYKVKINRKELLGVINRVSGFASNSTNLLVLEDSGMMELKVSAKDFDYSQTAEDYVMADGTMNGIRIGLSAEYLTEVLNIFSEDEISLQFSDPARPLYIEEGNIKALVMPIQVMD